MDVKNKEEKKSNPSLCLKQEYDIIHSREKPSVAWL